MLFNIDFDRLRRTLQRCYLVPFYFIFHESTRFANDLSDVDRITDIALHLNDGTTGIALEHRFRPIKKEAINMKTGIWCLQIS